MIDKTFININWHFHNKDDKDDLPFKWQARCPLWLPMIFESQIIKLVLIDCTVMFNIQRIQTKLQRYLLKRNLLLRRSQKTCRHPSIWTSNYAEVVLWLN